MTEGPPLPAIDLHAHYGIYESADPFRRDWLSAGPQEVMRRAKDAGVTLSAVSPLAALMPDGVEVAPANRHAFALVEKMPALRQWVVIHPRQPETYAQAEEMLAAPWVVGIKLHPEAHQYPIREYGGALFEFAAARHAIVLTHSGGPNSRPLDFIPWADRFPSVRLILAHLGLMDGGDHIQQVRAIQASRRGNVWTDTSSSKSIYSGLVEWAVQEIGAERILFGTDAPLHDTAMQRARVEAARIGPAAKRKILEDNALGLLATR